MFVGVCVCLCVRLCVVGGVCFVSACVWLNVALSACWSGCLVVPSFV